MYLVNRPANKIEKVVQRTFSELGFKERENLQEWIANNPGCLGEELLIILYAYSFPQRINLKTAIGLGIIKNSDSAPRGFQKITTSQFNVIMRETRTDESIVVD